MSNPNKQRGTRWESALVNHLTDRFGDTGAGLGLRPRRAVQEGFRDTGDLHGLGPFVAQAKDWKNWQDAIRVGLDGAEKQRVNAGSDYGVAFVKRARSGAGKGYALMTVDTWADLLLRLMEAEARASQSAPDTK